MGVKTRESGDYFTYFTLKTVRETHRKSAWFKGFFFILSGAVISTLTVKTPFQTQVKQGSAVEEMCDCVHLKKKKKSYLMCLSLIIV